MAVSGMDHDGRHGSAPMLSDALMCWNTSSSSGFRFFILRGISRDWSTVRWSEQHQRVAD